MESKRDVAGLIAELERSDDFEAPFIAPALGDLGDSSAVEPLLRRQRSIDLRTPVSDRVNHVAWDVIAEALGRLALPETLPQTNF
jgi:hypothetical protein